MDWAGSHPVRPSSIRSRSFGCTDSNPGGPGNSTSNFLPVAPVERTPEAAAGLLPVGAHKNRTGTMVSQRSLSSTSSTRGGVAATVRDVATHVHIRLYSER